MMYNQWVSHQFRIQKCKRVNYSQKKTRCVQNKWESVVQPVRETCSSLFRGWGKKKTKKKLIWTRISEKHPDSLSEKKPNSLARPVGRLTAQSEGQTRRSGRSPRIESMTQHGSTVASLMTTLTPPAGRCVTVEEAICVPLCLGFYAVFLKPQPLAFSVSCSCVIHF